MSKDPDWYRSEHWSPTIAKAFDEKLRRARASNRGQYLKIQALTLARSHPEVALALLDRYFELGVQFDRAVAFTVRANALLAMNRVDEAIAAFEDSLAREAGKPNVLTTTYVDYPFVVATRRLRERYARALEVLRLHERRLTFPIEHFQWNTARALIARDEGDDATARTHAQRALAAAAQQHSGISRHPSVGLVPASEAKVLRELRRLIAS